MKNIYLIGFMGSGKSSFGKKLAAALQFHFIDLDKRIEKQTGKTIVEIFDESGEDMFRKIESQVLADLNAGHSVIACGGGTPCFFQNMDTIKKDGISIYLKMSVKTLKDRLNRSHKERPLLQNLSKDRLDIEIPQMLDQRSYYYHQAEIIIDPLHLHAKQLAEYLSENYSR